MKYTIYKHTNKLTGKSYIGQTKYSIKHRLQEHYRDAKASSNSRNLTRPFHLALLKYKKDDWVSEVLEETTKEMAPTQEKYWIKHYNTYVNGYNATIGGDYLEGYVPPRGDNHPCTDTTVYTFYHRQYTSFKGTVNEFCLHTGLKTQSIRSLVKRPTNISIKGWVLSPLSLYFRTGIKMIELPKGDLVQKISKKVCSICKIKVIQKINKTCHQCRNTSGINNGMYNKKQPKHVGDIVRQRTYLYADQTLRNWHHSMYGVENQIKTIDLRNKYKLQNLSISALKKVTDKIHLQHKGWKLI